jgi:hypothetical protein
MKIISAIRGCNVRARWTDGRTDRQVDVKLKQTAVISEVIIANVPEVTQISLYSTADCHEVKDRSRRHLSFGRIPLTGANLPKRVFETRDTRLTATNCVG